MYPFPVIQSIHDILPAIKGRDEFIVADRGDHLIVNYLVKLSSTFDDPESARDEKTFRNYALRRECRGIIFDKKSGKILRRPYEKFFNVGEKSETGLTRLPLDEPHHILSKLDGSMIVPFYNQGQLRWGTKMGLTEVASLAENFARTKSNYLEFADLYINQTYTPIFEWCSLSQKIVLDYPIDQLILTAIRHMISGEYIPYDHMVEIAKKFNLEVVRALSGSIQNMESFIVETRQAKGIEGYVVRFTNGRQIKIKADDYVARHKMLEVVKWEKVLLGFILRDQLDDAMATMEPDWQKKVQQYSDAVLHNITETADRLKWIVIAAKENLNESKKRFAIEIANDHQPSNERSLLFSIWDAGEEHALDIVKNYVLHVSTTQPRLNANRNLIGGINWTDYNKEANPVEE